MGNPKFNVLAKQRLKIRVCFNPIYIQIPNPNRTKISKVLPKIAIQLIINHHIYSNSKTGKSNLIKHENSYNLQKKRKKRGELQYLRRRLKSQEANDDSSEVPETSWRGEEAAKEMEKNPASAQG